VDAPVAPGRVLGCHPQDQALQLRRRRRSTGRAVGLGPVASDQVPMPPQQRPRGHESMASALSGEQPRQRREHSAVQPGGSRPGDLSAQNRDLVSEHEDLGILGCLPTGEQCEPADELTEDQVEQSQRHDWRSSRIPTTGAKLQVHAMDRFSAPTGWWTTDWTQAASTSCSRSASTRCPGARATATSPWSPTTAPGVWSGVCPAKLRWTCR
jgi:hypothetical protein